MNALVHRHASLFASISEQTRGWKLCASAHHEFLAGSAQLAVKTLKAKAECLVQHCEDHHRSQSKASWSTARRLLHQS